jgi:hypothetical protein
MEEDIVVEIMETVQKKKWWGSKSRKNTIIIPEVDGSSLFLEKNIKAGGGELQEIARPEKEMSFDTENMFRLIAVSNEWLQLELSFPSITKDSQGNEYDLFLCGKWKISNPFIFLTSCGLSLTGIKEPLSNKTVLSWISSEIGTRVRNAVDEKDVDDLVGKDAIPAQVWQSFLHEWLENTGITVAIHKRPVWKSADAEVAKSEKKRQEEKRKKLTSIKQEQELEVEKAKAATNLQKEIDKINNDLTLSREEQAHQLEILRKKQAAELVQANKALESLRGQSERDALQHKFEMAKLSNDMEAISRAEKEQKEANRKYEELMEKIAAMEKGLEKKGDEISSLLTALSSSEQKKSYDAAETLVTQFDFTPELLNEMGFPASPQVFVERLKQKKLESESIRIEKTELITRNIGTKRVKGLPINTSLQFEFSTRKTGYLTLLNIGTSGDIFIHVPNAYVAPVQAEVEEGRVYGIPGRELLPWEKLREMELDYIEIGPPGWEHLAAIVSEKPLIDTRLLRKASFDNPFVQLTNEEFSELYEKLNEKSIGKWFAGVLSFLVE